MKEKGIAGVLLAMSTAAFGQDLKNSVADADEINFRKAIELRLPQLTSTDATRFLLNHSAVAVPLLRSAIEETAFNPASADSSSVSRFAEMIAYAANADAVDAAAELCSRSEERFSPMVIRLLDHAITRKREFEVAAYAADKYPILRKYVAEWLEGDLALPLSEELLAQSVLKHEAAGDRNPGGVLVPLLTERRREHFKTTLENVRAVEREKHQQGK